MKSIGSTQKKTVSFYQLKGVLNNIFESFGLIKNLIYKPLNNNLYEDGLMLFINNKHIADLGWPNSDLIKQADIKNNVFIADIFWNKLIALSKSTKVVFSPINKYPKVYRDLSLLINNDVKFDALKTTALKANSSILKEVHLFDIYKGKNLGPEKKSYALRFELHDNSKTLKDKEIDGTMKKIQQRLINDFNAELR